MNPCGGICLSAQAQMRKARVGQVRTCMHLSGPACTLGRHAVARAAPKNGMLLLFASVSVVDAERGPCLAQSLHLALGVAILKRGQLGP